jgi:hypothetical protein
MVDGGGAMIASESTGLRAPHGFWRTWLSWVAASTAAIVLGSLLLYGMVFAAKAVAPGVNEDRWLGWAIFLVLGTMLGAAQWIILRRRLRRAGWWIPATAGGWIVVIAAGDLLTRVGIAPGSESATTGVVLLSTLAAGISLGFLQLPILYRRIRWPFLWILASAIGWLTLGLAIGKSIDRTPDILALGAIPAAFTGLALAWLWVDSAPPSN